MVAHALQQPRVRQTCTSTQGTQIDELLKSSPNLDWNQAISLAACLSCLDVYSAGMAGVVLLLLLVSMLLALVVWLTRPERKQ